MRRGRVPSRGRRAGVAVLRGAVGLLGASHPAPTAVVTILSTGFVLVLGVPVARAALLGLAVLLGQLSVGWSNDWLDAPADRAVGRADKPAARGLVPVAVVRAAAVAGAVGCVVASLALGAVTGAVHLVAVAGGWAYNLGLKRTPWSWLPYAVSFALLAVVLVRVAGGTPPGALVAAGALLGAGAHVLNVLPDLEDDAATGVRGLPHRWGRRASAILGPLLLAAASVVVVAGLPGATGAAAVGAAGAVLLAAAAGLVSLVRPSSRAPFGLSMAVAGLCVLVVLASGLRVA